LRSEVERRLPVSRETPNDGIQFVQGKGIGIDDQSAFDCLMWVGLDMDG
jgi:hypothetical protein